MAWLALAMEAHWSQVRSRGLYGARVARRLRWLGTGALLLSLSACLFVDHASMAALVWVMTLSAAALAVAMVLAYRPRLLWWLAVVCGPRDEA